MHKKSSQLLDTVKCLAISITQSKHNKTFQKTIGHTHVLESNRPMLVYNTLQYRILAHISLHGTKMYATFRSNNSQKVKRNIKWISMTRSIASGCRSSQSNQYHIHKCLQRYLNKYLFDKIGTLDLKGAFA